MNERLFQIRKEVKLTQEQFAEKIGITRSAIANMESGSRSIVDRTISDICRVFNVSEKWLRTGQGEMFVQFDPEDELPGLMGKLGRDKNEFKKAMIALMLKMTDEQWESVEEVIRLAIKTADKK